MGGYVLSFPRAHGNISFKIRFCAGCATFYAMKETVERGQSGGGGVGRKARMHKLPKTCNFDDVSAHAQS